MSDLLTDDELDAIEGTFVETGTIYRAITELRGLRAKVSLFEGREQFSLDDFFTQADEIAELTKQTAALVAALEDIEQHHYNCDACDRIYDDLNLATVKARANLTDREIVPLFTELQGSGHLLPSSGEIFPPRTSVGGDA